MADAISRAKLEKLQITFIESSTEMSVSAHKYRFNIITLFRISILYTLKIINQYRCDGTQLLKPLITLLLPIHNNTH